ncbi:MAG TPA: amidohydrolase family protein [Thermodesulfobacteriota bacterium]|nr:amidohydrolase family protein [Thermodesulfobacteriota bacterium]HNU71131.1 amidohydrolase family protein [Thermodesulfobacteriota bacterium]HQO77691.1 amidohydrolase family protein [Thermodesulfobacteriota bacterium]
MSRTQQLVAVRWGIPLAIIVILLAMCLRLFAGPYRPIEPLPPGIVDMHCHLAGIGAGNSGCFVSARLRESWRFKVYLRAFGVSQSELEEKGDGVIADRISALLAQSTFVKKAVVLALDGVANKDGTFDRNRTEIYVPNEFVFDAVTRHRNLVFGASVNPYRSDALKRLEWAKEHGAVLVKWIPSIMEIDPADPCLIPFYRKLVDLNLPLLSHAGKERSFSSAADDFCDPDKLRLPLSLGVKVVAPHIASTGKYHGERSSDRLARLMSEYPNLYSDISSLTQVNKHFYLKEALTRPEFKGRLVYGSDFPLINTVLVSSWYYCLSLSPKQLLAISEMKNPWDADVQLKQNLGTPTDIFVRSEQLLALDAAKSELPKKQMEPGRDRGHGD